MSSFYVEIQIDKGKGVRVRSVDKDHKAGFPWSGWHDDRDGTDLAGALAAAMRWLVTQRFQSQTTLVASLTQRIASARALLQK